MAYGLVVVGGGGYKWTCKTNRQRRLKGKAKKRMLLMVLMVCKRGMGRHC